MAKIRWLKPQFVESMPDSLEDGIFYISEKYRIALHNCACGCGREVSTPLGPTEFSVRVDNGAVTVRPSIGNHDYPCRSHYLITDGGIDWAGAMSREAIQAGRDHDRLLKRGAPQKRTIFEWLKDIWAGIRNYFK
ncbi:DUF6527 family protein [Asticcacaulis sp.]|uniref:DUF6527 family protein n=1 Tax=Asticcacaulis sp. TaxID=1872648 RepID=UPI0031DE9220